MADEAFPEHALTRQELEQARDNMRSGGEFDNLDIFERLTLTIQAARCRKMGGLLFQARGGKLRQVELGPRENEAG